MSTNNFSDKRIIVWVQKFRDRDTLMLQWTDPDTGKRKSKSAGTNIKGVAEMKRTELEYELNHNLYHEASKMSWERFREIFEREHVSGCRPKTAIYYAETFNSFERLCSPTSLRAISARTISAFVGKLREQAGRSGKLQESTIKGRLDFLRAALAWAARQKLIPALPEFPKIKPPKRRPQPVPVESFERLLDKAPDDNTRAFEWEETDQAPYLDLARERIVFPATFVKAKEDQWVPLDCELRDVILALPRHGPKVFRYKKRHCHPRMMQYTIRDLAQQAGVKLTMRSLRRGFGCYWASRVPAQVLQKLMRHSSIALTMTYYANVDDAAMQAVLGRKPSLRNCSRNNEVKSAKENGESLDVNSRRFVS
jgi:integrase